MNDDVKGAVERAKWVDWTDPKSAQAAESAVAVLLRHIDAEPERRAAAVAREREEQREADARGCEDGAVCRCDSIDSDAQCGHCLGEAFAATVRATPLTATPLADRIAEAERGEDEAWRQTDSMRAERERLAAAVVAAREEQREACARSFEAAVPGGPTITNHHARACRATPLTATPLADRIAELGRERDSWKAAATMHEGLRAETLKANHNLQARVKELESTLSRNADDKSGLLNGPGSGTWSVFAERQTARAEKAEAERDELRQRILDSCPSPDEGGRIHAGGRIVCGQCHDSEVSHLRAQIAEAVAAAREEQREACAQFCEEEYYDVPHSECAFADSLEAIRATPLTATPLADELERAWNTTAKHVDERDAALERVRELERTWKGYAQLTEDFKLALAQPGTGHYVEFAKQCRAAWGREQALRGDLASALAERDGFSAIAAQCTRERDTALARVKELEADVEVGKETCRRHGTTRATAADGWPASKLIGFLSHSLAGKDAAIKDAAESASQLRSERDAAMLRVSSLQKSWDIDVKYLHAARKRAEEAEAERDTLKAQLAEAHERLEEFGVRRDGETATLVEGIGAMLGRLLDYRRWANEAEERERELKDQLAETVAFLRERVSPPWCKCSPESGCSTARIRAFLAKHPEGK